jgi:excisionase family DNA binding protein
MNKAGQHEKVVEVDQLAVRFLTAAKVMDCSESTIRKLVREGKLEAVTIGADRRIPIKSIKALLGA